MWGQMLRDGMVLRSQALEAMGLPFDASDEVRHMPISVIEVPAGKSQIEAEEERRPEPREEENEEEEEVEEDDGEEDA